MWTQRKQPPLTLEVVQNLVANVWAETLLPMLLQRSTPRTIMFFNVQKYGAVANGGNDNSKQFVRAWEDACQWNGKGVMLIPMGSYKLNPVEFRGPCKGSTVMRIVGDLQASTDISVKTWISFQHVDWLLVEGMGTVDGQGASAWSKGDCRHNHRLCRPLPISMGFNFVKIQISAT